MDTDFLYTANQIIDENNSKPYTKHYMLADPRQIRGASHIIYFKKEGGNVRSIVCLFYKFNDEGNKVAFTDEKMTRSWVEDYDGTNLLFYVEKSRSLKVKMIPPMRISYKYDDDTSPECSIF